jgi:uncharacterized membrane protein AbrB (regulator of aidB expression)
MVYHNMFIKIIIMKVIIIIISSYDSPSNFELFFFFFSVIKSSVGVRLGLRVNHQEVFSEESYKFYFVIFIIFVFIFSFFFSIFFSFLFYYRWCRYNISSYFNCIKVNENKDINGSREVKK